MLQVVLLRKLVVLMVFMLSISLINGQDPSMGSSDAVQSCTDDTCTTDLPVVTGSTIVPSTAIPSTAAATKAPETTIMETTMRPRLTTRKNIRTTPKSQMCYFESDPDNTFDCKIVYQYVKCIYGYIFSRPDLCQFSTSSEDSEESPLHRGNYNYFRRLLSSYSLVPIASNLPIYYHKRTFETYILAATGEVYVMPPLMNFYGQKYSVAQVISQQYSRQFQNKASPYYNSFSYYPTYSYGSYAGAQPAGSGLQFDQSHGQQNDDTGSNFRQHEAKYPSVLY